MYIIAEIGQAHEGSLGIAHSYIDALANTGVDAIKWQMHIADAESSLEEPFRVKFSYEDDQRIDYWRRMEFTFDQWKGLKDHCEEKGMEFICSPFSNAAVDALEELGVSKYKIGSGEVNNFLLLEKICKTGKTVLLSSGMSSYEELQEAVEFVQSHNNELVLFQCTTAYPTQAKDWGLNVIGELKQKFNLPIGFSDHSGGITACTAATALGATYLEFHVVFDKRMFGPDAKASLTIDETKSLCTAIRDVETALANPIEKSDNSRFVELKGIFEKSLAVNRNMKEGEIIKVEDLEGKKPKGFGLDASIFRSIVGKKLNKDLKEWSFLKEEDISDGEA
ncbi:MAG: N-acetylneuraminate synthase family protein [Bacteroidetes bacterium]|nr:N-acetylneuraminate synthase family protein [Bacteroidota bacterium]